MLVYSFFAKDRVFAFTPEKSAANLPARFGDWTPFKDLEMSRTGPQIPGVNKDECLDDIEAHGFHLTKAHVRITGQFI
jgi:hypothetical protein